MSLDLGKIGYETYINDKKYEKGLRKMERGAERTGKNIMRSLFGALSIYSGYRFFKGLVQSASDLVEAENKFKVVFQSIGDSAEKARKRLEKAFGRSKQESAELLGDAGDILTGLGFDPETALKMSAQASELGTDLASFTNFAGGAKGATIALTKAMLGESESAKALGIVIRQDSEEYKNLVKHYMTAEKMTLLQAKAQTALDIAMTQSQNSIGDYARTADEFANSSRRVGEQLKDVASILGKNLIPMAAKVIRLVSWGADALSGINGTLVSTIAYFGAWVAGMWGLSKITDVMKKLSAGFQQAAIDAGVMTTSMKQQKAIQGAISQRTAAFEDLQNKRRTVNEMQYRKQEALAALTSSRQRLATAITTGKGEKVARLKAKKAVDNLIKSKKALVIAEKAEIASMVQSSTVNAAATATISTNTIAKGINAKVTVALGKAKLFAAGAAKTLWAAMLANPFIVIIALIGLIIAGVNAWRDSTRKAIAEQVELATNATQASQKAFDLQQKKQLADMDSIERLKALSKVERLSNDEKAEAKELISTLTTRYGDLSMSIDKTTGKLNIQSSAFDKINKKMLAAQKAKIKVQKSDILAQIKERKNKVDNIVHGLKNENKTSDYFDWDEGWFDRGGVSLYDKIFGKGENEKAKEVQAEFDIIDALYEKLHVLKLLEKSQKIISAEERKNKISEARKLRNDLYHKKNKARKAQEAQWANDRLSDYNRELKAINEMVDAQKLRVRELQTYGRISKEIAKNSLKNAEGERKRLTDKLNAERDAENARKQAQDAELSKDLEYNQMKAKFLSDGKLDKQENISLAQKDIELQRQRVAEAKKLAEAAKAANKAQAKNVLAQAKIELGERMQDLKALTEEPLRAKRNIAKTGGFLATRVSLIGNQNPEKETAKNTKEMVKHTKNTEKYTKIISEKEDLTFD